MVPVVVQWAFIDDYMTSFYRVSHSFMTSNAPKRPHRSYNHDVLKVKDDHTKGVSIVCRCIVDMVRSGIEACLFYEGSP